MYPALQLPIHLTVFALFDTFMAFVTNGKRFAAQIEHAPFPVIPAPQVFQAFHLMEF